MMKKIALLTASLLLATTAHSADWTSYLNQGGFCNVPDNFEKKSALPKRLQGDVIDVIEPEEDAWYEGTTFVLSGATAFGHSISKINYWAESDVVGINLTFAPYARAERHNLSPKPTGYDFDSETKTLSCLVSTGG